MELWSDGVMEVVEPEAGIEPAAYGLQNRCSTAELFRRTVNVAEGHERLEITALRLTSFAQGIRLPR